MISILTIDLGGGGLRAGLVDRKGAVLATAAESFPGFAGDETDPDLWWRAAIRLADELAEAAGDGFEEVAAIAVTGFTRTQVLVDKAGAAVRPSIGFADARAEPLLEEALARLPPDCAEAGQINAFHAAMRLFWLSRNEPEALRRAAHVLEPKDYLNAQLTGHAASDRISSARLRAAAEGGADSALAALGLDRGLVPRLVEPTAIAGKVRHGLAGALGRLAGRPVLAMAHDTWAAVVGLGALRPGFAYNITGTTEVLGLITEHAATAEGLLSVDWGAAAHQLGGPSLAGGDAARWALTLFGGDIAGGGMDGLLAGPRQGGDLIFLPYLRGERTPWWDPSLRGAFIGLDSAHGPADLFRAVLEGVALLNRVVLDRAESATRVAAREIRFGGGGARNDAWARIKANACRRPVATTSAEEVGLLGCAIAAWTALGRFDGLEAAQDALVRVARRFEPDPTEAERFGRLLPLFLAAHDALQPISAALVEGRH